MLLIMITLAMSGCAKLLVDTDTSHLLTSVAQNEGSLETLYGIGRLSERNGNTEKAIEVYEAILEQHPDHANALHRMGIVNAKRGMLDDALKLLKQASTSETPSGELLGDIGYVYYLQGELDEAESALTEATKKSPENPRILNNLGIVAGAKKQFARSMDLFRQSNSEAESLASVAFLQSQTGQVDDAKDNFLRSLELDSKLDTAANGLISLQKSTPTRQPVQLPGNQPIQNAGPINNADQPHGVAPRRSPIQLASYEDPVGGKLAEPTSPESSLPQIATRLRGPKRSQVGQPIEFELLIENRSVSAAENVTVELKVSERMDVTVLDRQANFDGSNRTITWQVPSLAANSTETIKYSAVGRSAGSVLQTVSVAANSQPAGDLKLQTEISTRHSR
jgi:Tfp pilus assembly protein PilF